jgi:aspartate 1-decarboxylase
MEAEEARKYKPIVVFPNEENNLLTKWWFLF